MEVPSSTVRLAAVVKACGKPAPVTLWVDPDTDKTLRAAVKSNRVMTIKQETVGTRKDFGVIGFYWESNVGYWIFPKRLDAFRGKRVIGIDYTLVQEPQGSQPGEAPAAPLRRPPPRRSEPKPHGYDPRPSRAPTSPAPPPAVRPAPRPVRPAIARPLLRFQVTVRCSSVVDVLQSVEARTQSEAKAKALRLIADRKIDFSRGTESCSAARVTRVVESDQARPAAVVRQQK